MVPAALRVCEGCYVSRISPQRRGVRCQAKTRNPLASRVAQTVARKVQVTPETDFADTPSRRYLLPTGDPFPLGPLLYRKTVRKQLIKGVMWSFEQPQGLAFTNVQVNVRMTVTKMKDGSLLVYNPIAPTPECLELLSELDGEVKYIVLGSAAYEHKVFVGPFSRKFRKAEVHVCPQQWSFPLNLPVQFFGIFPTATIKEGDPSAPWADDFDTKVFTPPGFASVGLYAEVAMYHKPTRTLLLTDACIQLPRKPPECLSPATLLDNAKNGFVIRAADSQYAAGDTSSHIYDASPVADTPGNRLLGWQRICLLVCFFGPSSLYDPEESFSKYAGRPLVFPVVGSLVYSRCGESVRAWIESMAEDWDFKQIVPAHFAAPVPCTGKELIAAFQRSTDVYEDEDAKQSSSSSNGESGSFLQRLLMSRLAGSKPGEPVLDKADLKALEGLNQILEASKAVKMRPRSPLAGDSSESKQ